ncbi:MAG: DEAD/DEAH box helicase [Deltaproteobacteria bacterium]|nr:DEAD/DEAH box helicase [Deltaproteobacteria bacterium]
MNENNDYPGDAEAGVPVTEFGLSGEPPAGEIQEDQLIEPANALPEIALEDLPEPLRLAAGRAGWPRLMPVQAKAIPYFQARRDLMIQSQTGSGKTGAYLLPILERIDPERAVCQALVLVPTRELAQQVGKEAELLGEALGVRSIAVYGGVGYGPQLEAFKNGAHLVIGTPGRILDHLLKRSLTLQHLEVLVFDEADRMLSMGFYPDMKQVQEYLPDRRINGYMLSATFPEFVLRLAKQFLVDPEFLSLSRDQVHVAGTEHAYYITSGMDKDRSLIRIIEIENPVSALIFGNTKSTVHYLTVVLQRFGYDADELSSDLSQAAREKVMERIKKGELRFLVATDVAARGIDIHDLSHVIQYEPPEDPELYIHRVGRTGRAGAAGVAFSLVTPLEEIKLKQIAKRFSIELQERPVPDNAEVEALVGQRVTALLEAELRSRDSLQVERMRRFFPLAQTLGQGEELNLVAMLLDDFYQKTLQVRPPQPPLEERPKSGPSGKKRPPRKKDKDRPRRKR